MVTHIPQHILESLSGHQAAMVIDIAAYLDAGYCPTLTDHDGKRYVVNSFQGGFAGVMLTSHDTWTDFILPLSKLKGFVNA